MAKAQIPFYFDILETDAQLELLMLNEIVKELNRRIPARMPVIDTKLREATFNFLRATSTYQSLVGGELAAHFGIPVGGRQARIDNIVRAVANRMEIEFHPITRQGKNYSHGINIRVLLSNLGEVLPLAEGVVTTEKGEALEWLRWLLTEGDTIIISEYDVLLKTGKGRSGGGIMIADNAGAWRVPPRFAGTLRNNWLTRAFNDNINAYLSIIENIVKYELQRI